MPSPRPGAPPGPTGRPPGPTAPAAPPAAGPPGMFTPCMRIPSVSGVNGHSLYFVRPLNIRRLGSLLLLTTPTIPPPAAERVRGSKGGGCGFAPPPPAPPPPAPPPAAPAPPAPPPAGGCCWSEAYTSWNSPSLVIGSLYFLRKNRSLIRMSRFGGEALAYFRRNNRMARTYWPARHTSSASFSRLAAVFHTGTAAVRRTAITASATSRAAMA